MISLKIVSKKIYIESIAICFQITLLRVIPTLADYSDKVLDV